MSFPLVDIPPRAQISTRLRWNDLLMALRAAPPGKGLEVKPEDIHSRSRSMISFASALYIGCRNRGLKIGVRLGPDCVIIWLRGEIPPHAKPSIMAGRSGYRNDPERKRMARAKVSPERRAEIARMGGAASAKKFKKRIPQR